MLNNCIACSFDGRQSFDPLQARSHQYNKAQYEKLNDKRLIENADPNATIQKPLYEFWNPSVFLHIQGKSARNEFRNIDVVMWDFPIQELENQLIQIDPNLINTPKYQKAIEKMILQRIQKFLKKEFAIGPEENLNSVSGWLYFHGWYQKRIPDSSFPYYKHGLEVNTQYYSYLPYAGIPYQLGRKAKDVAYTFNDENSYVLPEPLQSL